MKKTLLIMLVIPLALWGRKKPTNALPATPAPQYIEAAKRAANKAHPRLFTDSAGFEALKSRLAGDEYLRMGAEHVRTLADSLVPVKPLERKMQGRRLLHVCREALYRINTLALAYRLYGDRRHLDRCVAELRAVCSFTDWNPSHYLDVAEMSLAVATGYDWLFNDMDGATRSEIAAGLRKHGMVPGHYGAWWIRTSNNWGQVCHAGMLAAALALAEENTLETAGFVQRCVEFLPCSMKSLAPNGNYPEGPGYWSYGVEFNVAALMMLEGTLGTSFGLIDEPGFKETAQYLNFVTGPSGMTFNYSDGGARRGTCAMAWWFAKRFNNPHLLAYYELESYRKYCTERKTVKGKSVPAHHGNRMFAYGLLSVEAPPDGITPRQPLVWNASGSVPITIQRSSWNNSDAMFVGLKGGSPRANHGHMDGGSFILESQKIRWALDLGAENYNKIEQLGLNLWSMGQNSERWNIYRLGTASHNVLMLDGLQQFVDGFGKVVEVKDDAAGGKVVLDLTSLYTNATKVVRSGEMSADGKRYELTDTVEGLRTGAPIRWAMVTDAAVEVQEDTVVLRRNGKTLRMKQTGALKGEWKVTEAKGPNSWDAENKNCSQITFTVPMPDQGAAGIGVEFVN